MKCRPTLLEERELAIVRQTREMNDIFVSSVARQIREAVMSGIGKAEAREIILRLTGKQAKG